MRNAYLETLHQLAEKDERVISLVSDNGLIVYDDFRRDFPDRYYNFGISEGNMVTAAAGMASCGKIPFAYTISAFLSYRAFEFIRDDLCFQRQNVKIVGIGSGTAYSTLGPSHHTTEDIGVLSALPHLTLFSPGSPLDARNIIRKAYELDGPVYVRLGTNGEKEIYETDYVFETGKGVEVRTGNDLTLIVTGSILSNVLEAAELLQKQYGVNARMINMHTLKPFDQEIVAKAAAETGTVVTVEEHNTRGGLGTLTAEAIVEKADTIPLFHKIGLPDCFARGYGTPEEVRRQNGLDAEGIFANIAEFLEGKGR